MSSFTTRLAVDPLIDGCGWVLLEPFEYHVGTKESTEVISVPVDFETDFASVPKPLMFFFPYWAKYQKAAVLHDYLYRVKTIMGKPITRKRADDIFREAMFVQWVNHPERNIIIYIEYWAVRAFAWLAWKDPFVRQKVECNTGANAEKSTENSPAG